MRSPGIRLRVMSVFSATLCNINIKYTYLYEYNLYNKDRFTDTLLIIVSFLFIPTAIHVNSISDNKHLGFALLILSLCSYICMVFLIVKPCRKNKHINLKKILQGIFSIKFIFSIIGFIAINSLFSLMFISNININEYYYYVKLYVYVSSLFPTLFVIHVVTEYYKYYVSCKTKRKYTPDYSIKSMDYSVYSLLFMLGLSTFISVIVCYGFNNVNTNGGLYIKPIGNYSFCLSIEEVYATSSILHDVKTYSYGHCINNQDILNEVYDNNNMIYNKFKIYVDSYNKSFILLYIYNFFTGKGYYYVGSKFDYYQYFTIISLNNTFEDLLNNNRVESDINGSVITKNKVTSDVIIKKNVTNDVITKNKFTSDVIIKKNVTNDVITKNKFTNDVIIKKNVTNDVTKDDICNFMEKHKNKSYDFSLNDFIAYYLVNYSNKNLTVYMNTGTQIKLDPGITIDQFEIAKPKAIYHQDDIRTLDYYLKDFEGTRFDPYRSEPDTWSVDGVVDLIKPSPDNKQIFGVNDDVDNRWFLIYETQTMILKYNKELDITANKAFDIMINNTKALDKLVNPINHLYFMDVDGNYLSDDTISIVENIHNILNQGSYTEDDIFIATLEQNTTKLKVSLENLYFRIEEGFQCGHEFKVGKGKPDGYRSHRDPGGESSVHSRSEDKVQKFESPSSKLVEQIAQAQQYCIEASIITNIQGVQSGSGVDIDGDELPQQNMFVEL
jgi:hypothetical protein